MCAKGQGPGRWVTKTGSRGTVFRVWEVGVRRIDPLILECTTYLYPSRTTASSGEQAGGTGFVVAYPSSDSSREPHLYVVTAKHVITDQRSPVIRLNTKQGDFEILSVSDSSWVPHHDGDDLAVCPIELDTNKHKFSCIPRSMLITKSEISEYGIGVGDEVFMVGRLINNEGRQKNTPTARFGNISMMPDEPLRHPSGILQESFVVESRSWPGFSGSPVFVWIPGSDQRTRSLMFVPGCGPWLLGVDWGHIQDWGTVYESDRKTAVSGKLEVKINTGMAGVVPAWRLRDLLECEQLSHQRQASESESRSKPQGASLDSQD